MAKKHCYRNSDVECNNECAGFYPNPESGIDCLELSTSKEMLSRIDKAEIWMSILIKYLGMSKNAISELAGLVASKF